MNQTPHTNSSFEDLLTFLKTSRGFDFTGYKRSSLIRRIDKRMQVVSVDNYMDYIDYLNVHPEEFTDLFNTILINVTGFFRDPSVWDYLAANIIPYLMENHQGAEQVRVWSVGCASGEEPYTIAMLLAEAMGQTNFINRVKIYATDLDEDALSRARAASYSPKEVESVPPDLLAKYFEKNGGTYLFNKDLRRSVIFGRHNIIHDAPISRIDLLLCRNLLMYLNSETQTQALTRLHFALKENGFLVLGKAEMLLAYSSLFSPIDLRARVFRPASKPSYRDRLQLIANNQNEEKTASLVSQFQIQEAAFQFSPVSQIVVDKSMLLALANECAQRQFNLSLADIGRPFQDLQVSYRPTELRAAIDRVQEERATLILNRVNWTGATGEQRFLEIILSPLLNNGSGVTAVLISFLDTTTQVNLMEKLETSNRELETTMAELQSANEELETTNEELQSTIEELETTNEELQSSNEEMETMNEELQSNNEELETISEEAHNQTEELLQVNQLLDGIIRGLKGGMIVTDKGARILKWNRKTEDLWGVRSDDMLEKYLFDLDIGLPVVELKPFVRNVLNGTSEREGITLPAINRRGKSITCQVEMRPMQNQDDEIVGLILLIDDQPV